MIFNLTILLGQRKTNPSRWKSIFQRRCRMLYGTRRYRTISLTTTCSGLVSLRKYNSVFNERRHRHHHLHIIIVTLGKCRSRKALTVSHWSLGTHRRCCRRCLSTRSQASVFVIPWAFSTTKALSSSRFSPYSIACVMCI